MSRALLASILLVASLPGPAPAAPQQATERPGPLGAGVTLLPNGWRIAPAGEHLDAGDLPLAMALHPDGRHLVITNNGWSKPSLRVVDVARRQVVQKLPLDHAWLGIAWHPDGKRLYSSGAADNSVLEVEWNGSKLTPGRRLVVAPPQATKDERLTNAGFMGGLAVSADGRVLYAAQVYGKAVVAVDLSSGAVLARRDLPAEAYTAVLAPDGRSLYVSVWGGARVAVLDARDSRTARGGGGWRAPERDAVLEGRPQALRRLRQHQRRLGDRPSGPQGLGAHRHRTLPEGAPRVDAERARALAGRRDAPRRERRQQHRRGRRRHASRREPLPGLHPDGLVPDRRRLRPGRR